MGRPVRPITAALGRTRGGAGPSASPHWDEGMLVGALMADILAIPATQNVFWVAGMAQMAANNAPTSVPSSRQGPAARQKLQSPFWRFTNGCPRNPVLGARDPGRKAIFLKDFLEKRPRISKFSPAGPNCGLRRKA